MSNATWLRPGRKRGPEPTRRPSRSSCRSRSASTDRAFACAAVLARATAALDIAASVRRYRIHHVKSGLGRLGSVEPRIRFRRVTNVPPKLSIQPSPSKTFGDKDAVSIGWTERTQQRAIGGIDDRDVARALVRHPEYRPRGLGRAAACPQRSLPRSRPTPGQAAAADPCRKASQGRSADRPRTSTAACELDRAGDTVARRVDARDATLLNVFATHT